MYNGDLECSFREYRIFDGFRKEFVKGIKEGNGEIEEGNSEE
jgi:hypothetical protein